MRPITTGEKTLASATCPHRAYLVAGTRPWSRRVFEEIRTLPDQWHLISRKEELTPELLETIQASFVFFLHWSWVVPDPIIEHYRCVCFHMTDVPYGRGGSPLQNLIVRGHRKTKLSALRMTKELDAGPVYRKKDLSLEGGAEGIYVRATELAAGMIAKLTSSDVDPEPQAGDPVLFRRRRASDSELPRLETLWGVFDFIRMLDADGYPPAYVDREGLRFEFTRAALYDGRVRANVTVTRLEGSS